MIELLQTKRVLAFLVGLFMGVWFQRFWMILAFILGLSLGWGGFILKHILLIK